MKSLFCFGMGYSATALAEKIVSLNWSIAGTCRNQDKHEELLKRGIQAYIFDGSTASFGLEILSNITHLLTSVPPSEKGDPVLRHYRKYITQMPNLVWVGYLSTTAVYGNRSGDWVDEESERRPTSNRGHRRAEAEDAWLELWDKNDVPVHVFRLAGIYGPNRNQLLAIQRHTARRIDKPGQVFSRIHIDDIVEVLFASMLQPAPGTTYNVCDDEPTSPTEVTEYACNLLDVTPPPLLPIESAELSPMARSFYNDNKRVRNDRIKKRLGVNLRYPNYRAGLDALHKHQDTS